jgi:hypothetical protein
MKPEIRIHGATGAVAAALLSLAVAAARAQDYTLDWFTIGGGGGTSTGGVYSASGTIGQPDAGTMSGGNFTLVGGYWGVVAAVQTPGAPRLSVARTATNTVLIAWPDPSTGYGLQQNADLRTTNWLDVATPPVVVGGQKQVVVPAPSGNRFYRLKK